MTIIELAMQREKEAEAYYRGLAAKAEDRGLRGILEKLAGVEARHYDVLKAMQGKKTDAPVEDARFLADMKAAFEKLRGAAGTFKFDVSQVELYRHAQQKETEARQFYAEQAAKAGSEQTATLFRRLAGQEQIHYQILGSIIEFVSRTEAGHWLENAEWYQREDY
jgi:rubrerythrin